MYLLPLDVDTQPFRFLPVLIIPVIAIAVIVAMIYFLRHRHGKKRS